LKLILIVKFTVAIDAIRFGWFVTPPSRSLVGEENSENEEDSERFNSGAPYECGNQMAHHCLIP
jgi:hypothetical protein